MTNESNKSYCTDGLGALIRKENVGGVCLGTFIGSNWCSSELRICPVSYIYSEYFNVLSDYLEKKTKTTKTFVPDKVFKVCI